MKMPHHREATIVEDERLHLKKIVLLAYTDLLAAGSRALLGMAMGKTYYSINIPLLPDCRPACVRDGPPEPTQQDFEPIQVLNCKYEQFSIVVVNTIVPGYKCHHVADTILQLCADSNVERIILLSVLHTDIPQDDWQDMYENPYSTDPVSNHLSLPGNTKIMDPFLSVFIQMIQIEGTVCNCFIILGHRELCCRVSQSENTHKAILRFQETIFDLTRLQFDADLSCSLLFKGENREDGNLAEMIYL